MIVVLFDTETTGLVANRTLALGKQPAVVEFYGCRADLETGEVLYEYGTLIHTDRPMQRKARGTHHITDAELSTAPPFKQVADTIRTVLTSAPVIIGHNLTFDQEMIELEFQRMNAPPPRWPQPICTVEQTIHLKGHRLQLHELYTLLFNDKFVAHRAKADCLAVLRCACELHKRGDLL
jgi:DNA polymerase III epsilon subunit-like protein